MNNSNNHKYPTRNRGGITENFWGSLQEETKTIWRIATFAICAIASLLIPKTGYHYLDWVIVGYSALTTLLIIDSQRSLGKYKNKQFKKRIIRTTIALSLAGIYFMLASYIAAFSLSMAHDFVATGIPITAIFCKDCPSASTTVIIISLLIVLFAISITLKTIEPTSILHKILDNTKNILIFHRTNADRMFQLAFFELVILLVNFIFVGSISHNLSLIIPIVNLYK